VFGTSVLELERGADVPLPEVQIAQIEINAAVRIIIGQRTEIADVSANAYMLVEKMPSRHRRS
jgi:hypothetical protein